MRNLIYLFALTFSFSLSASAESSEASFETPSCNWNSWFQKPQCGNTYPTGTDLYVKVQPQNYYDIYYMELWVNNHYIRKENNYPYEWAKPGSNGDHYLRNLQPGTYKLKVKIKDKCGYKHYKYCTIYVTGGGGGYCQKDFWYKYPQCGKTYTTGSDLYVRVDPQKYQDVKYMELWVNGHYIRKENNYPYEWAKGSSGDNYLRNLQAGTYKLKVKMKDKCGYSYYKYCTVYVGGYNPNPPGGNTSYCHPNVWFHKTKLEWPPLYLEWPPLHVKMYVNVKAQYSQGVEWMKLYVNGQFVRKESSAPYEWGKPYLKNDHPLRNLQQGTTIYLKVKIKDKCGDIYQISKSVLIPIS